MKITNANSDFQDFSKCDYSLHWSWSNFFRHIAVCNSMLDLPLAANVLEIGAADSPIENMLRDNFNRALVFTKTDLNEKYKDQMTIFDIEKEGLQRYLNESFDCIILTEVLEHFDPSNAPFILNEIHRCLKPSGKLLLTTPTPQKPKEQLVWPLDHDFEYSIDELCNLVKQAKFKINKLVPWSMHKKDYDEIFSESVNSCFPRGFIRAVCSTSAPINKSRQVFLELIKEN